MMSNERRFAPFRRNLHEGEGGQLLLMGRLANLPKFKVANDSEEIRERVMRKFQED